MPSYLEFRDLSTLNGITVLIDVRSEDEFQQGHIPGAVNVPLLPNEARKLVGTEYKQNGRDSAVKLGFELISKDFGHYFEEYRRLAINKNAVFYCWRGGLRSQIASTIYGWGGHEAYTIKGGYKAYRNVVLSGFKRPQKMVIISGYTGVGKTEILQIMQSSGYQIIDLEGLAHHKGSALGGLGMPAQDSQEMFENKLFEKWDSLEAGEILFLENESRKIGANVVPEALWDKMLVAPIIDLHVEAELRLQRIMLEYGHLPVEDLKICTEKLKKRLGGLNLKLAQDALDSGNITGWASILMAYYDRTYQHGRNQRQMKPMELFWDWNTPEASMAKLIELSSSLV